MKSFNAHKNLHAGNFQSFCWRRIFSNKTAQHHNGMTGSSDVTSHSLVCTGICFTVILVCYGGSRHFWCYNIEPKTDNWCSDYAVDGVSQISIGRARYKTHKSLWIKFRIHPRRNNLFITTAARKGVHILHPDTHYAIVAGRHQRICLIFGLS